MAVIIGTVGNDSLIGTVSNDTIQGLQGNDTIVSSLRNDILDGADGFDVANYLGNITAITLLPQGTVNKGSGTDNLIKVERIIAPVGLANTIDLSPSDPGVTTNADLSTGTLNVSGPFVGSFTVENFINVIGSINADTIVGSTVANNLSGNSGNDVLAGNNGNDTINGGNGNDTVGGENDNDLMIGSFGSDRLEGGFGNDTADYTNIGQAITLNTRGVTVNKGSAGTDTLTGVETVIAPTVNVNSVDGAGGSSINVNLGTDTLNVTGVGIFTLRNFVDVFGSPSNDTIVGSSVANLLDGQAGNDNLDGQDGNDTLLGSLGNDIIEGNTGVDTVDYVNLTDAIILGPTGIISKLGRNFFGESVVVGLDRLARIETIIAPTNTVNDSVNLINASTAGASANINVNLNINTLTVTGVGSFIVNNFDDVFGTPGNDAIAGNRNANFFVGFAGNDLVNGADNEDLLLGADPMTTLGFFERDTLTGGAESDTFILGDIFDSFIGTVPYYVGGGNNDLATITDYQAGLDQIFLDGSPDNYQISGQSIFFNTGSVTDLIATANQNINLTDLIFSDSVSNFTQNRVVAMSQMLT
ncbi:calcium-binding protein [Gloeocapsa sp. PCC 73106]|uniref:calcium-binding protein n=1 Tax=Gloeocapsa sp. PCC 73106 TaxID=102232 RepID=UPI0002AC087C|nr:calcium-binding protein [Gloeocapsa sp. PCC 73106]ELR99594.1 putative calcium-binding protein [Gloeocapsa sp. PCC 73106]